MPTPRRKKKTRRKRADNFRTETRQQRGWPSITNTQSYNKSHFKADCEGLISAGNTAQHAKTDDELTALKKTIASTVQSEIILYYVDVAGFDRADKGSKNTFAKNRRFSNH